MDDFAVLVDVLTDDEVVVVDLLTTGDGGSFPMAGYFLAVLSCSLFTAAFVTWIACAAVRAVVVLVCGGDAGRTRLTASLFLVGIASCA